MPVLLSLFNCFLIHNSGSEEKFKYLLNFQKNEISGWANVNLGLLACAKIFWPQSHEAEDPIKTITKALKYFRKAVKKGYASECEGYVEALEKYRVYLEPKHHRKATSAHVAIEDGEEGASAAAGVGLEETSDETSSEGEETLSLMRSPEDSQDPIAPKRSHVGSAPKRNFQDLKPEYVEKAEDQERCLSEYQRKKLNELIEDIKEGGRRGWPEKLYRNEFSRQLTHEDRLVYELKATRFSFRISQDIMEKNKGLTASF